MTADENVRPIVSAGANCAAWCQRAIPRGAMAVRVTFDVHVIIASVPVDRDICLFCAEALIERLKKVVRMCKTGRNQ